MRCAPRLRWCRQRYRRQTHLCCTDRAVNYTPVAAGRIVLRTDVSASGTLVPLLLSDIATIKLQSTQRSSYQRLNGEEAVIINALRRAGGNVVETMERLRRLMT